MVPGQQRCGELKSLDLPSDFEVNARKNGNPFNLRVAIHSSLMRNRQDTNVGSNEETLRTVRQPYDISFRVAVTASSPRTGTLGVISNRIARSKAKNKSVITAHRPPRESVHACQFAPRSLHYRIPLDVSRTNARQSRTSSLSRPSSLIPLRSHPDARKS